MSDEISKARQIAYFEALGTNQVRALVAEKKFDARTIMPAIEWLSQVDDEAGRSIAAFQAEMATTASRAAVAAERAATAAEAQARIANKALITANIAAATAAVALIISMAVAFHLLR